MKYAAIAVVLAFLFPLALIPHPNNKNVQETTFTQVED